MSKTAAWGLTNALRNELQPQGTQVLALHVGYIDTDLQGFDVPKTPPSVVAARALDALELGASEVMADDVSQQVNRNFSPCRSLSWASRSMKPAPMPGVVDALHAGMPGPARNPVLRLGISGAGDRLHHSQIDA